MDGAPRQPATGCSHSAGWTRPQPWRPSSRRPAGRCGRPTRSWAATARPASTSEPAGGAPRCAGRPARPGWPWCHRVPHGAGHWALGTPEAPHSATRSDSIRAASTFWPASMHRPRKAGRTSRKTPCTGNEICTWAVGNARSAGFMRDFISVVPFFACKAPGCSHPGERNRHLQLTCSTDCGTSPRPRRAGESP